MGDNIIFDGTDIVSGSAEMSLPKSGKSKRGCYGSLLNIMHVFSVGVHLPISYRILPGNIKDVKAFKLSIEEVGIQDFTAIVDKGFYSKDNIAKLKKEGINFIVPLRRNSAQIDYTVVQSGDKKRFDSYFKYEGRYIWYHKYLRGDDNIYLFLDEQLRVREQTDFMERVDEGIPSYTMEKFNERQYKFGTIALLSNQDKKAQDIYTDYKSRGEVEQMIDVLKNIIDGEKTYMQNEHALEGWMFVNYIALHWYYKIYNLLRKSDLLSKFSPADLLKFLIETKKVKINNSWFTAEITKKTKKLFDKLEISIT